MATKKTGAVKKEKMETMYVPLNELEVPPKVREYADKENLSLRWINSVKFQGDGGYHKNYWVPFNFQKAEIDLGLVLGAQDGFIRRGDTILAVRPKEISERHAKYLAGRNRLYKQAVEAKGQDSLKQTMREHGLRGRVLSGYDDE